MSAWNGTILELLVRDYDHREGVEIPPMEMAEMRRFAKMALEHIPGAARTFNDVFTATRPASDYVAPKLLDVGVPAFLWCSK
jgi:hypothetical protein